MKKIYLLSSIFIVLFILKSNCQTTEHNKIFDNWLFNINTGIPMFWGDVESTLSDQPMYRAGWGVILSKNLSSAFDIRGEFSMGNVAGSQPKYDRYFETDFYNYHIDGTLNFSNLIYGENPCRKLNIYGILGIGFFNYRSLLKKISTDEMIGHRGYVSLGAAEEYVTESFINGGLGISYRLDKRFDFNFENQWHFINTDLLDGKLGKFSYDVVSYTSVGITYKFNFKKNPNTFVDCSKGGYVKGKLDDGSNYYERKENDSLRCRTINNYYYNKDTVKVIIINDNDNYKLLDLENKLKELENRKNNVVPANITPVNNDKINELENKIKELENQKNNVVPANITPANNNDKINELENKLKELQNLKNNNMPANNITNNITNVGLDNLSLLSVFFDFNKYDILPSEMHKIEIVAQLILKDQNMKVLVTGHCDQKGTETYNDQLSKKRANAVAKVLIDKYKINSVRIIKEYKGKKNPISTEYSINRRVDFIKQ